MKIDSNYDVVIIGGGAAGLSGAVVLGRSRRSVLVVDAGEPRNAPAEGVHAFLTRDGVSPAELLRIGRKEAESYGAVIVNGSVTATARTEDGFSVTLDDDTVVGARRLLLTSGLVDELPDVPGLRERWGKDVVHCPYCHGWENRDKVIGVLGTGPMAVHQVMMFRQLSPKVTLFVHTMPELSDEDREKLAARGVGVIDSPVTAVESTGDALTGVVTEDGTTHAVQTLAVAPGFRPRSDMMAGLGLDTVPHPMGIGTVVETDPRGLTSVPGVWAAGNVTDPMAQVIKASADAVRAAAVINADLIEDEVNADLARYRSGQRPVNASARASIRLKVP
ncbi:NAD(P)/FAD-dependent oxidoreductase [Phytoactinopolyspora alkaliphila]|nr:NAD(P)/FAD-dependent oxidoreductase [Phytoactinopolyspora alkaliphila]